MSEPPPPQVIALQKHQDCLRRGDTLSNTFTHLGGARDGNRAERNWRCGYERREKEAVKKKRHGSASPVAPLASVQYID